MLKSRRTEYLLYILSNNKTYVRSSDLAKETGVSIRTIKNEMAKVSELAISFGAHVESVQSKGYLLVIDNQNVFISKLNKLEMEYRTGTKKIGLKDSETLELCRMILSGHLFTSMEQMAEELYLSKNSLWHKLQQFKPVLDQFFVRIEKNKQTGYFEITGNEYNIRTFMLYLSDNISPDHFYYQKWFDNQKIHRTLRDLTLNILIDDDFHITDPTTRLLEKYIIVSQNRYVSGYTLSFNRKDIHDIHSTEAYKIAYKMCLSCRDKLNYQLDDSEIDGLGLFLILNREDNLMDDYISRVSFLDEEVHKIYSYLVKKGFSFDTLNENSIKTLLSPILMSRHFHVAQNILDPSSVTGPLTLASSPYAVYLARNLLEMLEDKFGYDYLPQNVFYVANHILLNIISIPYDYRPIKVAVCSISGIAAANVLSSIIKRRYPELTIIETVELYELRNRDEKDFDVVISDFLGFIYRYAWEHINVNTIPTKKQLDMIYNSLILNAINLEQIIKEIGWEKIATYSDFNFSNENEFANLIAYKLGTSEKSINRIKDDILTSIDFCIENEIALFYVKQEYVKENVFEMYHLKNTKKIRDKKVDYIIVMTIPNDIKYSRFINDLSFALINNPDLVKKDFEEKTVQALCNTTKEALKTLPINLFDNCTK